MGKEAIQLNNHEEQGLNKRETKKDSKGKGDVLVMNIKKESSDIKKDCVVDELKSRIEGDKTRSKFLNKLEGKDVIEYIDDSIVVDFEKLAERKNYHFNLGKVEGRWISGSRTMLSEILNGMDIIAKSDYERGEMIYKKYEDLVAEIPNTTNRKEKLNTTEDVRNSLLEKFKEDGMYEEIDGLKVFDIEKLKEAYYGNLYLGTVDGKGCFANRMVIFSLLREFGEEVISKEDYEDSREKREDPKVKPLFNVPESLDEAFNVEKTKNKDYYLNAWDVSKNRLVYWDKEIEAKNGEKVMMNELAIMTKVYKDYQGKRENGKLLIYDEESDSYKKITDDWLKKEKVAHDPRRGKHRYILERCPNLQEKGLFTIDDFENFDTKGKSGELIRKEFFARNDGKLDPVIDSVRYYICRGSFNYGKEKIPVENIKVVILDNETAGIVVMYDGKEELKYTLDLLTEEEKEEQRQKVVKKAKKNLSHAEISARTYMNKNSLKGRIKPYSTTSVMNRKETESEEEYEKRRLNIADYGYVDTVTNKFVKDCSVGIHNLSWREQQWLAAAVYDAGVKNKYDEFVDFADKYGLEGLRTFLSFEQGENINDKILSIGENLKDRPEVADLIFQKYGEIVDLTKNINKEIGKMFNKDRDFSDSESIAIADNLLKKAKQILVEFSDKIDVDNNVLEDEIKTKLEEYQQDVVAFSSIFKTAYQKEKISFDELRGIEYKTVSSQDLEEEEKEMIRKAVKLNYKNKKQQEDIIGKIEESFLSEKTKWHLLARENSEKEKSLVSCIRFDEIDKDNVYAATFNVGTAYRGSNLGEAMFDRVMTEVAKERRINGVVETGKEVANFYINKSGFNVVEIIKNKKTGIDYYKLERFDPENEFYGTKKVSNSRDLMSYYAPETKIEDLIKFQKYILIKKEDADKKENLNSLNLILDNGYVMTRIMTEEEEKKDYYVFEKRIEVKKNNQKAA